MLTCNVPALQYASKTKKTMTRAAFKTEKYQAEKRHQTTCTYIRCTVNMYHLKFNTSHGEHIGEDPYLLSHKGILVVVLSIRQRSYHT